MGSLTAAVSRPFGGNFPRSCLNFIPVVYKLSMPMVLLLSTSELVCNCLVQCLFLFLFLRRIVIILFSSERCHLTLLYVRWCWFCVLFVIVRSAILRIPVCLLLLAVWFVAYVRIGGGRSTTILPCDVLRDGHFFPARRDLFSVRILFIWA